MTWSPPRQPHVSPKRHLHPPQQCRRQGGRCPRPLRSPGPPQPGPPRGRGASASGSRPRPRATPEAGRAGPRACPAAHERGSGAPRACARGDSARRRRTSTWRPRSAAPAPPRAGERARPPSWPGTGTSEDITTTKVSGYGERALVAELRGPPLLPSPPRPKARAPASGWASRPGGRGQEGVTGPTRR